MKLRNRQHIVTWVLLICAVCRAEPSDTAPLPASDLLSPEQALALFQKCGEEVLQLQSFECEIAYDRQAVMDSGSRTWQPADQYRITYTKPDLLRIEPMASQWDFSDWDEPLVFSSQNQMSFYLPKRERYASIDAPADFKHFIEDDQIQWNLGKLRFPLHHLGTVLSTQDSDQPAQVTHLTDSEIDNVKVRVLEVQFKKAGPDESLEGETPDKDANEYSFKVFIESEPPHLPRMIVSERPSAFSQETREDLGITMPWRRFVSTTRLDWRVDGEFPAESFAFKPAKNDVQVELSELFGVRPQAHPHTRSRPSERIGQSAPDFELTSLSGSPVALPDHLGKEVVVLDFWATWCVPCIRAMPELLDVAEQFRNRGVAVYAVNQKEGKDAVERFVKRKDWNIPVLLDRDGSVGDKYGADAIPTTVVIDRGGVIRYWNQGFTPDLGKELAALLESLTEG